MRLVLLALLVGWSAPVLGQEAPPRGTFAVDYALVTFANDAASAWHLATAEATRRTDAVTLVGRLNWAERFGASGVQVEADAYPRLSRGAYLYLNAGFADAAIFPRVRAGAELFSAVGEGLEASAGARQLWFRGGEATLLTASLARYAGDFYLAARPFVSLSDRSPGYSGVATVRRYLRGPDSFVTLAVGAGTAPGEAPLEFELERVGSVRATLWGRHPVGSGLGIRWTGGWEREEVAAGVERDRVTVGAGLEARF